MKARAEMCEISEISEISPLLLCRLGKFRCAVSAISPLGDGERGVPQAF
jgi:hypothetical protein